MDIGFIFILLVLLLPLIIIAIPVSLMVYGAVRGKKKLVIATSVVTLAIITLGGSFILIFPHHFPYVDSWIIGKSADEIISVYGEPDYHSDGYKMGYVVGTDNGFFGIMASNLDEYYYIRFDENGLANDVSIGIQPGG